MTYIAVENVTTSKSFILTRGEVKYPRPVQGAKTYGAQKIMARYFFPSGRQDVRVGRFCDRSGLVSIQHFEQPKMYSRHSTDGRQS